MMQAIAEALLFGFFFGAGFTPAAYLVVAAGQKIEDLVKRRRRFR